MIPFDPDETLPPADAGATLPPANDDFDFEETEPCSDIVPAGWAQHSFSHALSDLVGVLANLGLPEGKRVAVAAAYMKVERVGMAACRALDEQG